MTTKSYIVNTIGQLQIICLKTIPKISIPKIMLVLSSSLQLLQTFPIKIHNAGPTTVTISTILMFPQSFPMNSSLPKIMSFLSCCLQLLSILKIHAIGRGPPATISNLISSTYCKNRKSDPENQNYPT